MEAHYRNLRRLLGCMGFALPIILILGSICCGQIQNSISAYYYTSYIWLFCGLLFTIGFFLITYQGYSLTYKGYTFKDKWFTRIAGIFALGIAIFPTDKPNNMNCSCYSGIETYWDKSHTLHVVFAGLFFIAIGFISTFVFTRTHADEERANKNNITTQQKIARNLVYYICGAVIFISMILLVLAEALKLFRGIDLSSSCPRFVFYNETIMLMSFGTSWLVKGEVLFSDNGESYKRIIPNLLQKKFKERADRYNLN